MSVIPKKIETISPSDYKKNIILWVHSDEIFCIAFKSEKTTLKEAKSSQHLCYEFNDYIHDNVIHHKQRVYYGYAIYNKYDVLKFIITNKGTLIRIL